MDIRTILLIIVVLLALGAVYFLIKAIGTRDYGKVAQSLVVLCATIISVILSLPNGDTSSPTSVDTPSEGEPMLEITDQIETANFGVLAFKYITVFNRGTATAIDCALEIEYHSLEDTDYRFLGYSYTDTVDIERRSQSKFTITRSNPIEGAEDLDTCITCKEIRNYIDEGMNKIYLSVGDYYLKVTAVASNAKSSTREFTLHVSKDEPPILEVIR